MSFHESPRNAPQGIPFAYGVDPILPYIPCVIKISLAACLDTYFGSTMLTVWTGNA